MTTQANQVIKMNPGQVLYYDVLDHLGHKLCTIGIHEWGGGDGNVDVILDPSTQVGTAQAIVSGRRILDQRVPGAGCINIDIQKRKSDG